MNPPDGWGSYCLMKYSLLSAPNPGKKVIQSSYNTQDKRTLGKSMSGNLQCLVLTRTTCWNYTVCTKGSNPTHICVSLSHVVSIAGEPINCWVPAHFTGNHEEYTNSYCWIRNTYYLPFEEYIPKEHESDKRDMIPYYQWMPMILLVQALLFYLPVMIWRSFNARAGIDLNSIVEAGETFQNTELAEGREKTLRYMTKQMDR